MTTFAVLAHTDPQGLVAPHVHHLLRELRTVADRVVVVSMAYLTPSAVSGLAGRAELLHSDGHSAFGAWSTALDDVVGGPEGLSGLSRLLLVDHTLVGPTRPLAQVLPPGHRGLRGVVTAPGAVGHLDHRLLDMGADVLSDPLAGAFFTGVRSRPETPDSDHRLAVDLGRWAAAAGHQVDAVFTPSPADRVRVGLRDLIRGPSSLEAAGSTQSWPRAVWSRRGAPEDAWGVPWTPVLRGRLPFVPVDRLRELDEDALRSLSARFPAAFEGVPDYVERTALLVPRQPATARKA